MTPYTTYAGEIRKVYAYYKCPTVMAHGKGACPTKKPLINAQKIETQVWEAVSALNAQDNAPNLIHETFDKASEKMRRLVSDQTRYLRLAQKLSKLDQKRSGYQDQQAEGLITIQELRTKLAGIEEERQVIRNELAATDNAAQKLNELFSFRDTWLEKIHNGFFQHAHTPESRHDLYKKLGVRVEPDDEGNPIITGAFDKFSNEEPSTRRRSTASPR